MKCLKCNCDRTSVNSNVRCRFANFAETMLINHTKTCIKELVRWYDKDTPDDKCFCIDVVEYFWEVHDFECVMYVMKLIIKYTYKKYNVMYFIDAILERIESREDFHYFDKDLMTEWNEMKQEANRLKLLRPNYALIWCKNVLGLNDIITFTL